MFFLVFAVRTSTDKYTLLLSWHQEVIGVFSLLWPSAISISTIQHAQNCAAHELMHTSPQEYITLFGLELHSLSVSSKSFFLREPYFPLSTPQGTKLKFYMQKCPLGNFAKKLVQAGG